MNITLTLKDINYNEQKIVFDTTEGNQLICSFEFWKDINKYVTKKWQFVKPTDKQSCNKPII